VSLLHHTDAEITLSSRVDNPRDYPEHLVDGKPSTAWNGKTGDLGAWIEVKLDPKVQITAIAITSGFDKGDLFEKNLRIAKIRVEHDGALVKEATLDTSARHLQRIPIDRPGGTLKLTVLETVPGKNEAWKEIVVSELRVLGTAPPGVLRADSRMPRMRVAAGSAPAPLPASLQEVKVEGREGASLEAICAAFRADVMAIVRRAQKAGHGLEGYDPSEVKCKPTTLSPLAGTLPNGWTITTGVSLSYFDGVVVRDDLYPLMKRGDGVTVMGPLFSSANDVGDSPVPGYWRMGVALARGEPALLLAYAAAWHSPYDSSEADSLHVEHAARVCRFQPVRFTCDQPQPMIFRVDKLDGVRGAAFKAAPKAELPPIDPATGTLKPWRDFSP